MNELDNETQNDGQKDTKKDTKKKVMAVIIQTIITVILIAGGIWLVCRKNWQGDTEENASEDTIEDITEATEYPVNSEELEEADSGIEEVKPEVKQTIQSELMSGNFEHLDEGREIFEGVTYAEYMAERYPRWKEEDEWRQLDLNGDGIEDLILQMKRRDKDWEQQRILAIFACDKDSASCILLDENDMTEYYFCGSTGELMYTSPDQGRYVDFENYWHCYYDRDWNRIRDYELIIYRVNEDMGSEFPEWAEEWKSKHPDMAEDGVYFRRYTDEREEAFTREEFTEIYETVTGLGLHSSFFAEKIDD